MVHPRLDSFCDKYSGLDFGFSKKLGALLLGKVRSHLFMIFIERLRRMQAHTEIIRLGNTALNKIQWALPILLRAKQQPRKPH